MISMNHNHFIYEWIIIGVTFQFHILLLLFFYSPCFKDGIVKFKEEPVFF